MLSTALTTILSSVMDSFNIDAAMGQWLTSSYSLVMGIMMPLTMAKTGEENTIKKIGGKEETRRFLENLGFVVGGIVTVVSEIGGNMIVNVKDSRVAIGKDMANKIMI